MSMELDPQRHLGTAPRRAGATGPLSQAVRCLCQRGPRKGRCLTAGATGLQGSESDLKGVLQHRSRPRWPLYPWPGNPCLWPGTASPGSRNQREVQVEPCLKEERNGTDPQREAENKELCCLRTLPPRPMRALFLLGQHGCCSYNPIIPEEDRCGQCPLRRYLPRTVLQCDLGALALAEVQVASSTPILSLVCSAVCRGRTTDHHRMHSRN